MKDVNQRLKKMRREEKLKAKIADKYLAKSLFPWACISPSIKYVQWTSCTASSKTAGNWDCSDRMRLSISNISGGADASSVAIRR